MNDFVKGLSWRFIKTPGVDEILLVNETDQEIVIAELVLRTNVGIGVGKNAKNLDEEVKEAIGAKASQEDVSRKKEELFLEAMKEPDTGDEEERRLYATDIYLCAWGALTRGGPSKRTSDGKAFQLEITYVTPLKVPPRGTASLSYANSFKYLVYRSLIRDLATLPILSLRRKDDTSIKPVELTAIIAAMKGADGPRKIVTKEDANIVTGASLPRRVLGYYANYFPYQRDIFVRDLPFAHLNEVSYGMFSLTPQGVPASSDKWGDDWQISSLQFLRQLNPDLKVNLIVGGWPKELTFDIHWVGSNLSVVPDLPRDTARNPDVTLYAGECSSSDGKVRKRVYFMRRWIAFNKDQPGDLGPDSFVRPFNLPKEAKDLPIPNKFLPLSFRDAADLASLIDQAVPAAQPIWYKDMDQALQVQIQCLVAEAFQHSILPASDLFSTISKDPDKRHRFSSSIVEAVGTMGFDGVEIDWEYPTAADGPGYVALLRDLRNCADAWMKNNPGKQRINIGIAAPASVEKIRRLDQVAPEDGDLDTYWRTIGELVDTVHIMTYDYGGNWLDRSDFNAPMHAASTAPHSSSEQPSGVADTIETMLGYVNSLCLTRRQLSMGVPFYGRAVYVSSDEASRPADISDQDWALGINRPVLKLSDAGQFGDQSGTYLYSHILQEMEKGAASTSFPAFAASPSLHPKARAPSLLTVKNGNAMLLTYENPASIREKVRYLRQQALGGVMAWDMSGDVPTDNPKSLLRALADEMRQERPALRPEIRKAARQGLLSDAALAGTPLPSRRLWAAARDYGGLRNVRTIAQTEAMLAMAPLPRGRLAVALAGGTIQIMAVNNGVKDRPWQALQSWRPGAVARSLLALPSGRILAMLDDGRLVCLASDPDNLALVRTVASGLPTSLPVSLIPGWGDDCLLLAKGKLYLCRDAATIEPLFADDAPIVQSAIAMPGGLLVTGGARAGAIPTVGVWDVTGGKAVFRGAPPRAANEDWGDIAFMTVLADGSVAALTSYGNYQVYGPDALDPAQMVPAWCAGARKQRVGHALLALPHGGFMSITDNAYMFWSRQSDHGYTLVHRLAPECPFRAAAVLDDGSVVISRQADSFLHIEARSWPRQEATLRTSWDWRDGKEGLSWLHRLAIAGNVEGMERALADGAPADLVSDSPEKPISLLGTALQQGQWAMVPLLVAAGAPLWSVPDVSRVAQPSFSEGALAGLLPPSLREAVPHLVPDLPTGQSVTIPADIAAFLDDHPRLAMQMVASLAPTLPDMARAIQHIIQDYAVDDDLLAVAAGNGDAALMHLIPADDGTVDDSKTAEGVGEDLRTVLSGLKGRRFADDAALLVAIDAAWTAPDKDRPWRQYERDQIVSAASRPRRPEAFRLEEKRADCEEALRLYGRLLDLGWPVMAKGKPDTLSNVAPVLFSQLMQAGRDNLLPEAADDLVIDPQVAANLLPPAVTDFLLAAPYMAEPLAKTADNLLPGLGQPVRAFSAAEQEAQRVSIADLSAIQDPFQSLGELEGGVHMAGAAMYALIRARTLSPRGGRPTRSQVLDFLARRRCLEWLPEAETTGFPQSGFAWTRDPLSLPADPTMLPDQGTDVSGLDGMAASRMAGALLTVTAVPVADPIDHKASEYRRQTQALHETQMKFQLQSWQNKVKFDVSVQKQMDEAARRDPYVQKATFLTRQVTNADADISRTRTKLDRLDSLALKPVSAAKMRSLGYDIATPAGRGDNDPMSPAEFKDAINGEKARLTADCTDKVATRDRLENEANKMKRNAQVNAAGRANDVAKARSNLKEAQRNLSKMQDYAIVAEKLKYYGDKAIDWLLQQDKISAETAKVLHKVLDIANKVIKVATAIGAAFYSYKQTQALGGVGGLGKMDEFTAMLSIGLTVFSMITGIFSEPEPDPMEEMYKALAGQLEQVQKSLSIISDQLTILSAHIDERFDELDAKLDGMMRDLNGKLESMSQAIEAGFTLTRQEIRQSTAQLLLALQRGFDAVDRRLDMLGGRLEGDVRYVQQMMTTGLMTEYEEIDIAIGKEETEILTLPETALRLSNDPRQLVEYRNRLIGGVRDKLLGLAPQRLEDTLDGGWLQNWPVAVGAAAGAIGSVMLDRIGDCYDFYVRRGSGAQTQGARVYFAAPYGRRLADRLLWVSERLVRFTGSPEIMAADIDDLLVTPLQRMTGFLKEMPANLEFFDALLSDYTLAVKAVAAECETIIAGDVVQAWRLPAIRLQDVGFLTGLVFDDTPVLSLTDLAADTVTSNAAARRTAHLADFARYLEGPALGWRARRLVRTLSLAHALNVADLFLTEEEEGAKVTLWVSLHGASQPVAQFTMLAGRVMDSELLMTGNRLLVRIARACRAVQGQAVIAFNHRMESGANMKLKALDTAVERLVLFLGLAGLSEAGMAETMGQIWHSGRIQAYLAAQSDMARHRGDGDPRSWDFSPPLATMLRGSVDGQIRDSVRTALSRLSGLDAEDVRRDPLPGRLLTELEELLGRAASHLATLRSISLPSNVELLEA